MQTLILTIHILLAIGITVLVLMQRSEGGALGSLGGGQGASALFTGRQAGNMLTRLTSYFFIGFICTSLALVIMAKNAPDNTDPAAQANATPITGNMPTPATQPQTPMAPTQPAGE